MPIMQFKPEDYKRIMDALDRVKKTAHKEIEDTMQRDCATQFRFRLINNMVGNKFSSRFVPLTKRYAAWKANVYKGYQQFWMLGGDLMKNLQVFKDRYDKQDGWMAGIPAGAMDRGGKNWKMNAAPRDISRYARAGEFGGKYQEERPMFRYTQDEFIDDGSLDQFGKAALQRIKLQWR
jgi:hypothetical protein